MNISIIENVNKKETNQNKLSKYFQQAKFFFVIFVTEFLLGAFPRVLTNGHIEQGNIS